MDSESETESENESKSEIDSELVHLEIETHTDADDEVVNSEINDILNNQVCYISFRILSFDFTQELSNTRFYVKVFVYAFLHLCTYLF